MSQDPSDLERLLGPDRRQVPRPHGLALVVAVIALAILIGLIALRPGGPAAIDLEAFGFVDSVLSAEVESVQVGPCSYAPELNCQTVVFTVGTGTHSQEFPDETGQPELEVGDRVYLSLVQGDDGTVSVNYYDRSRGPLLAVVALVFAAAVIILGRLRGVAALAGLAISVAILLWFIVPAIIAGRDAVLVALVGGERSSSSPSTWPTAIHP